ncbi:dUTP diphosphatase [Bacillus inaquosorum]|uniref:dUTP diphosphatase n=1 Tax=Bacillus inaquosorum TaxID=483913 RepID=UPI00228101FC|nr:dUTP diphosphatase [Bacillus inaquosorum]MCY8282841.1 dUTP diphosphatase [Bacillus inaquosorum]MCY9408799.1 dUTP diphosphatase [Bacillus inaquosorum]MCY9417467.1 dUTP diphosphatase [Bacillus inaquosorum]MCY9456723.1 dUTP diphosphatase [Bacillus inaquosorum]
MNLEKMFEMQKALDERIIKEKGLEGQDLLPNLILALQVELAECANEWRGFKHWSNNREPRTKIEHFCPTCDGTGDENHDINLQYLEEGHVAEPYSKCQDCNGSGKIDESNPLLEEYVDCLHFILSIGNRIGFNNDAMIQQIIKRSKERELETNIGIGKAFSHLMSLVFGFYFSIEDEGTYVRSFERFLNLGQQLGFTPEQIEAAYMEKNAVNHQRQQEGY